MKHPFPKIFACLLMASILSGCTGAGAILGGEMLGFYATKPSDPPPADTDSQIAPHESWCYMTMGDPECYATPQDVPPTRLINVEPQNRYPLDVHAYNEDLAHVK